MCSVCRWYDVWLVGAWCLPAATLLSNDDVEERGRESVQEKNEVQGDKREENEREERTTSGEQTAGTKKVPPGNKMTQKGRRREERELGYQLARTWTPCILYITAEAASRRLLNRQAVLSPTDLLEAPSQTGDLPAPTEASCPSAARTAPFRGPPGLSPAFPESFAARGRSQPAIRLHANQVSHYQSSQRSSRMFCPG